MIQAIDAMFMWKWWDKWIYLLQHLDGFDLLQQKCINYTTKRHLKYKMLNMMITFSDIRGHFTQVIAIICKVFTWFMAVGIHLTSH